MGFDWLATPTQNGICLKDTALAERVFVIVATEKEMIGFTWSLLDSGDAAGALKMFNRVLEFAERLPAGYSDSWLPRSTKVARDNTVDWAETLPTVGFKAGLTL